MACGFVAGQYDGPGCQLWPGPETFGRLSAGVDGAWSPWYAGNGLRVLCVAVVTPHRHGHLQTRCAQTEVGTSLVTSSVPDRNSDVLGQKVWAVALCRESYPAPTSLLLSLPKLATMKNQRGPTMLRLVLHLFLPAFARIPSLFLAKSMSTKKTAELRLEKVFGKLDRSRG
mgnify:CR=1 FL=1